MRYTITNRDGNQFWTLKVETWDERITKVNLDRAKFLIGQPIWRALEYPLVVKWKVEQ